MVVIDQREDAAHQPPGGVAQGDGQDGVGDVIGHDVEVNLPEDHEGGQHDVGGRLADARPTEGAGVDLVDADKHITGAHIPQK